MWNHLFLASNHCTLYIKGNFICLIAVISKWGPSMLFFFHEKFSQLVFLKRKPGRRYDPIIEATQAGTNTGVKARKSMHRLVWKMTVSMVMLTFKGASGTRVCHS